MILTTIQNNNSNGFSGITCTMYFRWRTLMLHSWQICIIFIPTALRWLGGCSCEAFSPQPVTTSITTTSINQIYFYFQYLQTAIHVTNSDRDNQEPRLSASYEIMNTYNRDEAAQIVNEFLLPSSEYGRRIALGLQAQNLHEMDGVILNVNDPVLSESYGEFPEKSLDTLLDRSMQVLNDNNSNNSKRRRITIIDLGSGCGRLALYLSLSRGDDSCSWDVHGIELSPVFHSEAIKAATRAIDSNWMKPNPNIEISATSTSPTESNTLQLHVGSAEKYLHIIQQADIIFCYSTAWDTNGFSPDVGAMILNQYWSELLTKNTKNKNPIIITTEKVIDPFYDNNWKILDRIDVPNPEVFGSTGFIQQRK